MKVRYESFGGIIGLEKPPALIFVDKDYMRNLGYKDDPIWESQDEHLSSPIEVHLNPTNQCPLRCKHCYTDSGNKLENELSLDELKKVVDILSEMGVFHVALGGGESFGMEGFLELARYVRAKGIVPNVTTNGYLMTKEMAKQCNLFGQINVSVDGIGETYRMSRGYDGFRMAKSAHVVFQDKTLDTSWTSQKVGTHRLILSNSEDGLRMRLNLVKACPRTK